MGARDLIKKAWDNAQNRNADIYAEVYDGNYSDIIDYYSQYGNFTYDIISGSLSVEFYYSCNPLLANMRYYLITILMQICCFTCAQVKISILSCKAQVSTSQLAGTKWKQTSPKYGYKETTWEFTTNQLKTVSHYVSSNEKIENVFPYYISDSFPSVFIHNCVGKNYTGKYLVTYLERWNRMDWYTITSIDWNTGDMYLFRQPAEDEVGGRPVTIHFKLISKGYHRGGRR